MSKVPPPNLKKATKKAPPPPRLPSAPTALEQETVISSSQNQLQLAASRQELNPISEKSVDLVTEISKNEPEPTQEVNLEKITPEHAAQEKVQREIVNPPPPPKKLPIPNKSAGVPRKPNIAPPAPPKVKQQKEEQIPAQPVSSPVQDSKDVVQQQKTETIQREPVIEAVAPHVKIVGVRTPPPPTKGGKPTRPKPPTNLKTKQDHQVEAKTEQKEPSIENKQIQQQTAKQPPPVIQEAKPTVKQEVLKPPSIPSLPVPAPPTPVETKPIPKPEMKAPPKPQHKSIPKPPQVQKKATVPPVPQQKKQVAALIPAAKPIEPIIPDKKDNALANKLEQLRKARQMMKQQQQLEEEQQQEQEQEQQEQSNSVQQYTDEDHDDEEQEVVVAEAEIKKEQKQPIKVETVQKNPEKQAIITEQSPKEKQKTVSIDEIAPNNSDSAPEITTAQPTIVDKPAIKPPSIKTFPKIPPKPAQPPKLQPPKKISIPDSHPEEPEEQKQNSMQIKDLPPSHIQKIQIQPIKPPIVQQKPAIIHPIQVSQSLPKEPISLRVKKPEGAEEIERLLEEYRKLKQSYIGNLEALGELTEQQNRQERAAGERVERLLAGLSELDQRLQERCRVICE